MTEEKTESLLEKRLALAAELLFFPLSLFLMELLTITVTTGFQGNQGVLYVALFSLAAGALLYGLCALFRGRARIAVTIAVLALLLLLFGVQTVYYHIFQTFMGLSSLGMAGDALEEFGPQAVSGIVHCIPYLFLLSLPLIVYIAFRRRLQPQRARSWRPAAAALALFALLQGLGAAAVRRDSEGITSYRYVYCDTFSPLLSVPRFGVLTTLRLDVRELSASRAALPDAPAGSPEDAAPADDVPAVPTKKPSDLLLSAPAPQPSQDPDAQPADEPEETPDPEPAPPEPPAWNVLDIDFDALIAAAPNKTVQELHTYFSQVEPTRKNEYTGMFAGKNLIWIVAESFSPLALDPAYTPVLCRLSREGFVFKNFYTPLWDKSTIDGEYVTLQSLLPKSGILSFPRSAKNYLPFTVAHLLESEGYTNRAYHDFSNYYFDRNKSHPNMGYDYKAIYHGLDVSDDVFPPSDVEMMEVSIPEFIDDETPFHTYYLTMSGHKDYGWYENAQSAKYRDALKDSGLSEEAASYIGSQMELDRAMTCLISALENAGKLADTVIVLSGDHYPYGLSQRSLEELYGGPLDKTFERHRGTLVIWNSRMETVVVDKPCSSLDILPTVCNLFGLPYDSRLLMGRDILSDAPGLVFFNSRSFITDLGRYNSSTDVFTPYENAEVPEGYAQSVMQIIKDKFSYSAKVLDQNYYAWVFQ